LKESRWLKMVFEAGLKARFVDEFALTKVREYGDFDSDGR